MKKFLILLFLIPICTFAQTDELVKEFESCMQLRNYDCAIKTGKKLVKKAKSDRAKVIYQANLGTAYRRNGQNDQALKLYGESIETLDNTFARNNRGTLLLAMGQLDEAKEDFEAILAINPENVEGYSGIGRIALEKGDTTAGMDWLTQGLALDSADLGVAVSRCIVLRRQKKYDETLSEYNRLLKLNPNAEVLLNNRADLFMYMERYEEALTDINKAIKLNPEYGGANVTRAEIYQAMNRVDEACAEFKVALKKGVPAEQVNELNKVCDL